MKNINENSSTNLSGGALAIGSLYWDKRPIRFAWRSNHLDMGNIMRCLVPIRYGRLSESSRNGVYTMVFSNELSYSQYGNGIVIPFTEKITSFELFTIANKQLARAEGIIKEGEAARQTIVTSWGTNCILINPAAPIEKQNQILEWWTKLFTIEKEQHNLKNQSKFSLRNYGLDSDRPCITDNGVLQVDFPSGIDCDFLLGTANKVKLRDNASQYPNAKEIARAMVESNNLSYFYYNRMNGIYTSDDKMVKKVLRKKYGINSNEISRLAKIID
jgi:hypothetical protein